MPGEAYQLAFGGTRWTQGGEGKWMTGHGLEAIFWMRLERLHHRLLKVENLREPPAPPMDFISTASKVLGLVYALGRFLVWATPWLTMAGLMLWGWLKRSVLGLP